MTPYFSRTRNMLILTAPGCLSLFSSLPPALPPPQAGKNWMFTNAKSPPHCELMCSHLRNRITADSAHFELRLHLIYLTNDVLHHW